MPKNPKLNIARYKVDGGELNEYEFHKNQQAFVQQQEPEALIPGTPPEQQIPPAGAGALGESMPNVATPAAKKSTKKATTKRTAQKSTKKTTAKKSSKKAKPAKAARASKSGTSKRASKPAKGRSTKKATKKLGTKKARKK
jgi:RNA polymerase primary sigma factor